MIHATTALILATLAIWIVWDFYALHEGGYSATETGIIRGAMQHPIISLAVGVLIGHLFLC